MDLSAIDMQAHVFPFVIFCFAVAIGIELTLGHFKALLAKPQIPILGTLVHTVTFPVLAGMFVTVILVLDLPVEGHLILGILLVAACPSGGFSNVLVLLARADLALSVLLTAVSSVLSFLTVPFFFWLFGYLMPELTGEVNLPVGQTLLSLLLMVVIPVGLGMLWRALQEEFVVRHTKRIQNVVQVVFYIVIIIVIFQDRDTMLQGLGTALPLSLLLCVLALGSGFGVAKLVGLSAVDCATVAIEGSIRNLAVAFLIATTVMNRIDIAILPTVYFMAVLVVGLSFARFWRTRMAPKYAQQAEPGDAQ